MRAGQAIIKGCSFDESCPWMGSSLVPVSVQHRLPQYHLVIRAELLPRGPVFTMNINSIPVAASKDNSF